MSYIATGVHNQKRPLGAPPVLGPGEASYVFAGPTGIVTDLDAAPPAQSVTGTQTNLTALFPNIAPGPTPGPVADYSDGAVLQLDAAYFPSFSLTGSRVESWTDRKSGRVFSALNATARPTLDNASFSLPCVDFWDNTEEGYNCYLKTNTPLTITADSSVFMVFRNGNTVGNPVSLSLQNGIHSSAIELSNSKPYWSLFSPSGTTEAVPQVMGPSTGWASGQGSNIGPGKPAIVSFRSNGKAGDTVIRRDGTLLLKNLGDPTVALGGNVDTLGSTDYNYLSNSSLCELLVFNSYLSMEQTRYIEEALKSKWGNLVGKIGDDFDYPTDAVFDLRDVSLSQLDRSLSPKIFTATGKADVVRTNSKVGETSMYFPGVVGHGFTTPYNSAFDIGTQDLTFRCWLYIQENSIPDYDGLRGCAVFNAWQTSLVGGFQIGINGDATKTGTGINFDTWHPGGSNANLYRVAAPLPLRRWIHLECSSFSGVRSVFLNGLKQTGDTIVVGSGYSQFNTSGSNINFGRSPNTSYPIPFNGFMNRMQLIRGRALHTASFNPYTGKTL